MKKYLRLYLFNLAALWTVVNMLPGVSLKGGWQTFALAALVLSLVDLVVKPLINILLLPINLLTLGAFRWLTNVVALYLVTVFVPELEISGFKFSGFSTSSFAISSMYLTKFWVFILASFLISLITSFLMWLNK